MICPCLPYRFTYITLYFGFPENGEHGKVSLCWKRIPSQVDPIDLPFFSLGG